MQHKRLSKGWFCRFLLEALKGFQYTWHKIKGNKMKIVRS